MDQLNTKRDCIQCRSCCMFGNDEVFFAPLVTDGERKVLVDDLGKDASNFFKSGAIWQIKLVDYGDDKSCPFLDTESWLCGIYDHRPFDCRIYPYLIMWDTKKENVILSLHVGQCPANDCKSDSDRCLYKDCIINYLSSDYVIDLLSKYPQLVWDYQKDFEKVVKLPVLTTLLR